MTYIDDIAAAIREEVPQEHLPDSDTSMLFRIYAVVVMAKGTGVALEDVHNAWSAWMSAQNPDHPSLKPLSDLQPDIRDADQPFLEAILRVARERGLGPVVGG